MPTPEQTCGMLFNVAHQVIAKAATFIMQHKTGTLTPDMFGREDSGLDGLVVKCK